MILTVMITPIMIAITVDAPLRDPARLEGGRGRARRQPLAGDVDGHGARRAPGDHRRRRARDRARALGEAIMLSMVSGSKGFAPNPADGLTFIFEPLRTLASTIVEDAESLNAPGDAGVGSTRSRCCCCSRALVLSIGGWIAKQPHEEVRDRASDGATAPRRRRRCARRDSAPAAQAPASTSRCATWRWGDRIGYVADVLGVGPRRCARSPAAIVVYMAVKRRAVPATSTC